jgi:hypothetical protein
MLSIPLVGLEIETSVENIIYLPMTLTSLTLDCMQLNDDSFAHLLSLTHLKQVNLDIDYFHYSEMMKMCESWPNLTHLTLSLNPILPSKPRAASLLPSSSYRLSSHSSLQYLCVRTHIRSDAGEVVDPMITTMISSWFTMPLLTLDISKFEASDQRTKAYHEDEEDWPPTVMSDGDDDGEGDEGDEGDEDDDEEAKANGSLARVMKVNEMKENMTTTQSRRLDGDDDGEGDEGDEGAEGDQDDDEAKANRSLAV